MDIKQLIEQFNNTHNNQYDYSEMKFTTFSKDITIICKIHGKFEQRAEHHRNGSGCPQCSLLRRAAIKVEKAANAFYDKARAKHGNKYNYDKVIYKSATDLVTITCSKHGDFEQTPNRHLSKSGCPSCGLLLQGNARRLSQEDFIRKSIEVHGDKYDYTNAIYINSKSKLTIGCKVHRRI